MIPGSLDRPPDQWCATISAGEPSCCSDSCCSRDRHDRRRVLDSGTASLSPDGSLRLNHPPRAVRAPGRVPHRLRRRLCASRIRGTSCFDRRPVVGPWLAVLAQGWSYSARGCSSDHRERREALAGSRGDHVGEHRPRQLASDCVMPALDLRAGETVERVRGWLPVAVTLGMRSPDLPCGASYRDGPLRGRRKMSCRESDGQARAT